MRSRTPFIGEILTIPSPIDPEVEFGVKRLANKDILALRDRDSVVRFITEEESGRYIQEKDYPAGTRRLDTVVAGLSTWNIADDNNKPVEVTRENILLYLDPEELDFVHDQIYEKNPILSGQSRKND